jgi:hypothetical protein
MATDETGTTREGVHNSRATHIWSDGNPHAIREYRFQNKFSIINCWVGIVSK